MNAPVLMCLLAASAAAQTVTITLPPGDRLELYKESMERALTPGQREIGIGQLLNILNDPTRLFRYASRGVRLESTLFDGLVQAWERARVDEQVGGNVLAAAATNLVSRASTPNLFGIAVENGGLLQDTNGSAVTFRGNADGLIRALAGEPLYCVGCVGTRGLRNLNFSASFDLNRGTAEPVEVAGPATGNTPALERVLFPRSSRQLSTFTARYDVYNPRDPRSQEFQEAWKAWFARKQPELEAAGLALLNAIGPGLLTNVQKDTRFGDWRVRFNKDLQAANASTITTITRNYLDELVVLVRTIVPDWDLRVRAAEQAYARYAVVYDDAIRDLNGSPQFTAEYTFSRPLNQPEMHNVRLVWGYNPRGGRGLLTTNLASTFYGEVLQQARYGRVRDIQASLQFDRPLGALIRHPAVLTLAGYYQYQFEPAVIKIGPGNLAPDTNIQLPTDAAVLLGPKGHMGVVQAKLTLKMGGSGLRMPLAVTWSNRTELIRAEDIRGQIGLTYDLDSLLVSRDALQ